MSNSTKTAIIEISSYYNDPIDQAKMVSVHETTEEATEAETALNEKPYRLSHNQASGYYCLAPVIDDRACYQTWLDSAVDWEGCPSEDGSDNDANCTWAEQRAIAEGGTIPLNLPEDNYRRGDLVLVELPPQGQL